MLMTKDRRPAIRTLRGWAISVLQEAGAIRECEEHGWNRDCLMLADEQLQNHADLLPPACVSGLWLNKGTAHFNRGEWRFALDATRKARDLIDRMTPAVVSCWAAGINSFRPRTYFNDPRLRWVSLTRPSKRQSALFKRWTGARSPSKSPGLSA